MKLDITRFPIELLAFMLPEQPRLLCVSLNEALRGPVELVSQKMLRALHSLIRTFLSQSPFISV